ncbi:MAG: hypothetical protein FWB79_04095 [Treponema sp.]|nr:hypothetical protein [Treponema sp.]
MGTIDLPGKTASPGGENPGTDAFRGGPFRDAQFRRDIRQATAGILGENTDRILLHLEATVSATVSATLSAGGGKPLGRAAKKELREKLYAYIERNYGELLCRLSRDHDGLTRREVGRLLDSMGGADGFNTGEIEKSGAAAFREPPEARAVGAPKGDAAAFVPWENACHVLSCVFSDNAARPKTVTDLKLSLNISEYDLLSPAARHKATAMHLIGDLICGHLFGEIERVARDEAGQATDARELAGRILERCTENAVPAVAEIALPEGACGRGFDAALGLLVSLLADRGLDYQFMERLADGDDVRIREYEDTDPDALPDERYTVRLRYFDRARLDFERGAYDAAVGAYDAAVGHFLDLLDVIYRDSKSVFRINDFDDLARKNGKRVKGEPVGRPAVERCFRLRGRAGLAQIRGRMDTVRESLNPAERRVSEERLAFLEREYARLERMADPHRIRPGILLDVEASSVKRKRTTLDSMSGVLDEFLKRLPDAFRPDVDGA